MRAALAALRDQPIPATSKGFGRLAADGTATSANGAPADGTIVINGTVTSASLAERRPYLLGPDFMLPVLVLREAALRQNIEAMAGYCASAGVGLAPHGKTTMAPQLFARQLAAGAWGMTAATIAQVQVYRAFGVPRVLIANELADRGAIEWLAAELAADPGFECYAFVDSAAGVRLLDDSLRAGGARRPLPVLVELGQPGGRAGCRSVDEALAVAGAAASAGTLRLAGAAGFEGNIHGDSAAATVTAVAAFCRELRTLGDLLPADPAGTPHLLSAGGSAYFDIVAAQLTAARPGHPRPEVLIRSGAYITHDHGLYAAIGPGARARTVGAGAVPARAWPGRGERRTARYRLRPGAAGAAPDPARGRARDASRPAAGHQARRSACAPERPGRVTARPW
jgi:D-serine deaminase-like pyridoxal phosphate-dependent protein